jgi:ribonuclease HI
MGRRIILLVSLVAATASSTSLSSSTIDISISSPTRLSKILHNLEGDSNNDNDEHDDNDIRNRATTVVRLDDDVDDEEESSLDTEYQSDYQRRHRDPFVNASPLSVAAVCRDGVALVSLHYDIDLPEKKKVDESREKNNELEAVSVIKALEETTAMEVTDSQTNNDNNINIRQSSLAISSYFRDLPPSTRGPLRIESIHDNKLRDNRAPSMALLTAGWRTDGIVLADAARTLMADEVRNDAIKITIQTLYCLISGSSVLFS